MDIRVARVHCRGNARGNESRSAAGQTGISAVYAFNVDSVPSPRESEFGFRSPIVPHLRRLFQFYEEWLSAMRLEL